MLLTNYTTSIITTDTMSSGFTGHEEIAQLTQSTRSVGLWRRFGDDSCLCVVGDE
jgi:hypothetical protein